jgi:hypothetical protein
VKNKLLIAQKQLSGQAYQQDVGEQTAAPQKHTQYILGKYVPLMAEYRAAPANGIRFNGKVIRRTKKFFFINWKSFLRDCFFILDSSQHPSSRIVSVNTLANWTKNRTWQMI